MKLTDEELRQYYERYGIRREDLRSTEPVSLAELPADITLSADLRRYLLSILDGWNDLDDMSKIDAAYEMERRVLTKKDTESYKRLEAWAGYLLLGRIRDCDERRQTMEKIARGELLAPLPRPTRRTRGSDPAREHRLRKSTITNHPISAKRD